MGKPTETRNQNACGPSREQHSRVGAESDTNKTLDHVVRVVLRILCELQRGQDEIRQQLAGHTKPYLNVEEFGQLVARAPYTVRQWIKEGRINAIRVADNTVELKDGDEIRAGHTRFMYRVEVAAVGRTAIAFSEVEGRMKDGAGFHTIFNEIVKPGKKK